MLVGSPVLWQIVRRLWRAAAISFSHPEGNLTAESFCEPDPSVLLPGSYKHVIVPKQMKNWSWTLDRGCTTVRITARLRLDWNLIFTLLLDLLLLWWMGNACDCLSETHMVWPFVQRAGPGAETCDVLCMRRAPRRTQTGLKLQLKTHTWKETVVLCF